MGFPQFLVLALVAFSCVLAIANDGKSRTPWSAEYTFLGAIVWLGLLFWGGFFGA